MMDTDKKIFISKTRGIWHRLITRIFAQWFGLTWLLFSFIGAIIKHIEDDEVVMKIIIGGIVFTGLVVISMMFLDRPSMWNNQVALDFEKKKMVVRHGKERLLSETLSFDEIDAFSARHLGSFLLKDMYLVKIYFGDKELKLLAFSSSKEYVQFIAYLKNQLKLKSVADTYYSKNLFWRFVPNPDRS